MGLLGVIRHGGELGGIGIAALTLQERFNIRAGYTQLACDIVIFAIALAIFPLQSVLWSFLGAVVLNMVIAWNHIPGRYNSLM